VVSNRPDAAGLAFAQTHGIATAVVDHKTFAQREASTQNSPQPSKVLARRAGAAGFMRILSPAFVKRFERRMVNIHPSLLRRSPGCTRTAVPSRRAASWQGATVHFVTAELDHGPIIAQAVVPVLPGDTEATLNARVLAREHVIYPRAVRWLTEGVLREDKGVVTHTKGETQLLI